MPNKWIIKFSIIVLLSSMLYVHVNCKKVKVHPEFDLTIEQRIRLHGYPVEAHQIVTEDDYLITVNHIPHGLQKEEPENKNKSAVLIIHGMGGSPHTFILLGPEISSAYYFADRGMDVWLFSSRGVAGSFEKRHKTLDWDKDSDYWLYSFHEIGIYDLPATIDFILKYTGQEKISLIGHSAGGNEFFCMLSEKPEYNDKVKVAINWGSSPIIKRMDYSIVQFGVTLTDAFKRIVKYTNMIEFAPFLQSLRPMVKAMCEDSEWEKLCVVASYIIGSHKSFLQRPQETQLLVSILPRLSSMIIIHFMDNIRNGTFRKYDYGSKKNMKVYGQKHPPSYNLSAAIAPVAFFVGLNDDEIMKEDVEEAIGYLPNTILLYEVPFAKFTHLDFILAHNASALVYEPTYRLINDIDNGIMPPPIKMYSSNND